MNSRAHLSDEKIIELIGINKTYGDNHVLNDINLYIRKNEFITFLGPSGCGKTTTLRIISGFEKPDSGKVMFKDKDISEIPPYLRSVNTVFQNYALFPHLNVAENISFGLKIKKMDKDIIADKVNAMLEMVNLQGYQKRSIDSLSGGQRQRVAIARALVNEPEVLLLDEPLAALDLKLRKDMQLELKDMQQRLGITFLYVTHDQEEALTMSDTIVVMDKGVIQQIGKPTDIYNEPKNAFVADFIGESNIVHGIVPRNNTVIFGGAVFNCVDTGFEPGEEVDVVIRPEDFYVVDETAAIKNTELLRGEVTSNIFKGVHYEMTMRCGYLDWLVQNTASYEVGQKVGLYMRPEDIHLMKREGDSHETHINLVEGIVYDEGVVEIAGNRFNCDTGDYDVDETLDIVIRPEDIKLGDSEDDMMTGEVVSCIFTGEKYEIIVLANGIEWLTYSDIPKDTRQFASVTIDENTLFLLKKQTAPGATNMLNATVCENGVTIAGYFVECDAPGAVGDSVKAEIRPGSIFIVDPGHGSLQGRVVSTEYKGIYYNVMVDIGGVICKVRDKETWDIGAAVGLYVHPLDVTIHTEGNK